MNEQMSHIDTVKVSPPYFQSKKIKRCYFYFFPSRIVAKALKKHGKYYEILPNDMVKIFWKALNTDKRWMIGETILPKKIFYDKNGFFALRSYNTIPILFYDVNGEMIDETNPFINEIMIRDRRIQTATRLLLNMEKEIELISAGEMERVGMLSKYMEQFKQSLTLTPTESYMISEKRIIPEREEGEAVA